MKNIVPSLKYYSKNVPNVGEDRFPVPFSWRSIKKLRAEYNSTITAALTSNISG